MSSYNNLSKNTCHHCGRNNYHNFKLCGTTGDLYPYIKPISLETYNRRMAQHALNMKIFRQREHQHTPQQNALRDLAIRKLQSRFKVHLAKKELASLIRNKSQRSIPLFYHAKRKLSDKRGVNRIKPNWKTMSIKVLARIEKNRLSALAKQQSIKDRIEKNRLEALRRRSLFK